MPDFHRPEELIEEMAQGRIVILVDDEDRENEGDLVLAAQFATPEKINFMAKEARGLICLALTAEQVDRLALPQMVRDDLNLTPNKTAFTVSIEATSGVSTGISASDRAHTIRVASHPGASPSDVRSPGHIFPIRAQAGGVLRRAGHTEGSVDLARLAGLIPAAVICEVMKDDGSMARVPDLREFAKKFGLKMGTIVDLIEYRLSRETLVEEVFPEKTIPLKLSPSWQVRVFKSRVDGKEHLVLQKGIIREQKAPLVRVQNESFYRDLLALAEEQKTPLQASIEAIEREGCGLVLVLGDESNQHSLSQFIKSVVVDQSNGFSMDHRHYGTGAQILRALGLKQIRLLTNRPEKRIGLKAFDLEILENVSLNINSGRKSL